MTLPLRPHLIVEQDAKVKRKAKWLHVTLLAIGAILVLRLLAKTGYDQWRDALSTCRWSYIGIAACLYTLVQVLRASQWHYLISRVHPGCMWFKTVCCYVTNGFFSNFTPLRSGESIAPLLLEEHCGSTKSTSLAVIVVCRCLDLLGLLTALVCSGLYLAWRVQGGSDMIPFVFIGAGLLAVGILALIGLMLGTRRWMYGYDDATPATGIVAKVMHLFWLFRSAVRDVVRIPRLLACGLITAGTWIIEFARVYFVMNAIAELNWIDSSACHTTAFAAGLLSFVPGGLGVIETSYAAAAELLGYRWSTVATASIFAAAAMNLTHLGLAALASFVLSSTRTTTSKTFTDEQAPA